MVKQRAVLAGAALIFAVLVGSAHAKPRSNAMTDACVDAADRGQVERDEGRLRLARQRFVTCANPSCPVAIRTDCTQWLAAVEARLPSISIIARDDSGRDVVDVRVSMDGETLQTHLDGRAIQIDPGQHEFVFERAGSEPVVERVLMHEGEAVRALRIVFRSRTQPVQATSTRAPREQPASAGGQLPIVSLVLAGVGVAAAGSYAYFGLNTMSGVDDLRATCAPHCAPSQVDDARRQLLFTNVSFGVSAVAFAAALVTFLTRKTH